MPDDPDEAVYDGEIIPSPLARHMLEQQLDMIDWHPLFTGRCPQCEMTLLQAELPRVHWDCICGWVDDSV